MTFTPIIPRATRLWLRSLQMGLPLYCLRCPAISVEAAAEEGTGLANAYLAALEDSSLVELDPNVITREIEALITPHEFKDGPVFWDDRRG